MIIFHQKIVLFTYTHSPFHDHHRSMYVKFKSGWNPLSGNNKNINWG